MPSTLDRGLTWMHKLVSEQRAFVLFAACSGLVLRLLLLWYFRHNVMFADELDYQQIAQSLVQKHAFMIDGHITAFRPPGQPLLIASSYELFGPHLLFVKLIEQLALTALPFLCSSITRTLRFHPLPAAVAVLLVAFDPALAYTATTVYPTIITTVLLTAGVVYGGLASRRNDLWAATKAGLSFGLAGLFTTTFVPVPALAAVYLLYKRRLRSALIVALIGLLPAVVWIARNRAELGTWSLATNGGMNLYLGANDEATPRSGNWVQTAPVAGDEVEKDHGLAELGKRWIQGHSLRWSKLWIERAFLVVDSVGRPKTGGAHTGLGSKLLGYLMFPFTILGLAGLAVYRRTPEAWMLFFALILVILSSATTIVKPRFRFPCDPVLTVFALGAVGVFTRFRSADGETYLGGDGPSHTGVHKGKES